MHSPTPDADKPQTAAKTEFEKAGEEQAPSIVSEFIYFVRENKKWWLIPVLLVIAFIGALAALSATGLAPAIYTVF